jgi:[ribosomal protein S5]-alanine N-acetyltransferase
VVKQPGSAPAVRARIIETKDLRLIPYRPADLLALIEGVEAFRHSFGFAAAEGLREFLLGPEVAPGYIEMLSSSSEPDIWRHGFALLDRESEVVAGNAAFVAPPDEKGEVEIAYGIVPAFEGRGYATQAARALTEFALAEERVTWVKAHTLPENNASTRVLEKNEFTFVGEIHHPEDGLIWRWERRR